MVYYSGVDIMDDSKHPPPASTPPSAVGTYILGSYIYIYIHTIIIYIYTVLYYIYGVYKYIHICYI